MVLSVTVEGVDMAASMTTVGVDASDTLKEAVGYFNRKRATVDPDADWDTYFVVRLGVRQAVSGNWEVYLWPIYGSPKDPAERPYYTRLTITATFPDGTEVDIDTAAGAEVVGHGQTIPPTVVTWNPTTELVVSTESGVTKAFVETSRVKSNPNGTGFNVDGEFAVRFDHTVDDEDRDVFYALASRPGVFVEDTGGLGRFHRADDPGPGERFGWAVNDGAGSASTGGYVIWDDRAAKNYPITHIGLKSRNENQDVGKWDNVWTRGIWGQRADSGIGPYFLMLMSRGAAHLKDFGHAWLVKATACKLLRKFPDPFKNHSRNIFVHRYDASAMRAKGRALGSLTLCWRVLVNMLTTRNVDSEVTELFNALTTRITNIVTSLVVDFNNDSWLERRDGGRNIGWWEAGNYWHGLLHVQEAYHLIFGALEPNVDKMMRTIANAIFDNTLLWDTGQPHPRDSSVTYTGAEEGYHLEWVQDLVNPGASGPSPSISQTIIAVWEWLKVNDPKTGADATKLDAIIAGYAGVNYKWKLGTTVAPKLVGQWQPAAVATLEMGTPKVDQRANLDWSAVATLEADGLGRPLQKATLDWSAVATLEGNPKLAGGEKKVRRKGTVIQVDSRSVGDVIEVGPMVSNNEEGKGFTVVRGDDFEQPFDPKLDQGRTLDGTETWRSTVRKTKAGSVLATFNSPVGIEVDPTTFKPSIVFDALSLPEANFPISDQDEQYWIDLEMSKGGEFETAYINKVTVVSDVSR